VQYVFLWAWGRQTQEPPRAAHTLATPLVLTSNVVLYSGVTDGGPEAVA